MQKIALLILGLALFVTLSKQDCPAEDTTCVYSGKDCTGYEPNHCCKQVAQVLALAAASARASAYAYASAHACAYACTGASAHAYAAACATAHVCITQAVCLSINTGKCCEVSASIAANATSYASAVAYSSSFATGRAAAAASASANAHAAASSAASLFASAKAIIEGSCCDFNLKIVATVEAVGNFSSRASVAADTAVSVSSYASLTSESCARASKAVSASTATMLSAGINNCCVANQTRLLAQNSSAECKSIVDRAGDLQTFTQTTFDYIESGVADYDEIIDPVELYTLISTPECKDAIIGCCYEGCGCNVNPDTCSLVAETYVYVAMETKAAVDALVGALAYSKSTVTVRTSALAAVRAAADAAVLASLVVDVNVKSCCSIVVTVSQTAFAYASSVGSAFAKARACAVAYAEGYATSYALSTAIASANATGFALAKLTYEGCCGQDCCKDQTCCNIANECKLAVAGDIASDCAEDTAECAISCQDHSPAFDIMKDTETTKVLSVVSTQTAYLLQCCCCTKAPTTTTTKRVSFSSTSFSFSG